MDLSIIIESLEKSPVVKRGDYNYFINPLTDGIPEVSAELIMQAALALEQIMDLDADYILTIESMGFPISSILSQITGLPVKMIRKKQYFLEDEKILEQSTGYSESRLYMNYVKKGDRVVIVDSVISTGGTLRAVLKSLNELCVEVVDIACIVSKGVGKDEIYREFSKKVKYLVEVEVGEKVSVKPTEK